MADPLTFVCNGESVTVDVEPDESLLDVLRERLGIHSVKDGCAPQGQCGCCTVLVDGRPRVACVTPAARVRDRAVATLEGLDPALRDGLADAFLARGASQCGFCTPGILVRCAPLVEAGSDDVRPVDRTTLDRALAAHLCRCTGWQTIYEAVNRFGAAHFPRGEVRGARAAQRAELEGGAGQRVARDVVLGHGGFADDTAPLDALVAVPLAPSSDADAIDAADVRWVVGESLAEVRARAGKVQGRRTTLAPSPPLGVPECPDGGVALATGWVEPAYLEPDASWCAPGGEPASPLANGGAFGGKLVSVAPAAARELAGRLGRTVRVVLSREDVVRLGPKRPPISCTAVLDGSRVRIEGRAAGIVPPLDPGPYELDVALDVAADRVSGPPVSTDLRAPNAEWAVLVEGALEEAGADRSTLLRDERLAAVLLDTCVTSGPAAAGARVSIDAATSAVSGISVRVAAGDPLDDVVLRSYVIGASHMALGWVLTEGLAVDSESGEVLDLTIRSFGIVPARNVPPIDVEIVDDPGPPLPRASDAVFAAVAAALWNAVARAEGARPSSFPGLDTAASAALRR
jgi:aerobic-type carbon monoxide dehydrogenase small subunit (CoxS/CutS family)